MTVRKALPEVDFIGVCSHLERGTQRDVDTWSCTRGHQLCPRGNSIDSDHGDGGTDVGVYHNLDRTLVCQRLGNSSPRGREQSQEDKEKLPAWNLDTCQLVKCFRESKHTCCAHNQRHAYRDQGHHIQELTAEGQRRGWWAVRVVCRRSSSRRSASTGHRVKQLRAISTYVLGRFFPGEEN